MYAGKTTTSRTNNSEKAHPKIPSSGWAWAMLRRTAQKALIEVPTLVKTRLMNGGGNRSLEESVARRGLSI